MTPVLLWFRRDLRLFDNPALSAALSDAASGRGLLPVFILDPGPDVRPPGEASLWWLNRSLAVLAADLEARGSRLILRRGDPAVVLPALAAGNCNGSSPVATVGNCDVSAGSWECMHCARLGSFSTSFAFHFMIVNA